MLWRKCILWHIWFSSFSANRFALRLPVPRGFHSEFFKHFFTAFSRLWSCFSSFLPRLFSSFSLSPHLSFSPRFSPSLSLCRSHCYSRPSLSPHFSVAVSCTNVVLVSVSVPCVYTLLSLPNVCRKRGCCKSPQGRKMRKSAEDEGRATLFALTLLSLSLSFFFCSVFVRSSSFFYLSSVDLSRWWCRGSFLF